jgi:hypothetical protein
LITDYVINPFERHELAPTRVGVLGCPEARERESLWWSASLGKRIHPRDMSLAHLINALRMLLREVGVYSPAPSHLYSYASLDAIVRRRTGGTLLLEEWDRRAHPHTPHWSLGHVPFEREWWEQRRLGALVEPHPGDGAAR